MDEYAPLDEEGELLPQRMFTEKCLRMCMGMLSDCYGIKYYNNIHRCYLFRLRTIDYQDRSFSSDYYEKCKTVLITSSDTCIGGNDLNISSKIN